MLFTYTAPVATTFPPTYKYIPNTNNYDRRPEKKNRCPAWCDRVLWRTRISQNTTSILNNIEKQIKATHMRNCQTGKKCYKLKRTKGKIPQIENRSPTNLIRKEPLQTGAKW